MKIAILALTAAVLCSGCDNADSAGKQIWQQNCQVCHGPGLAGAPRIGHRKEWAARLNKGSDTLTEHAIRGFAGPGGHEMPARGGNPELTDEDVAAAVRYMISQSQ